VIAPLAAVDCAPWLSVTTRLIVYVPTGKSAEKVLVVPIIVLLDFQTQLEINPLKAVLRVPSKLTVTGLLPMVVRFNVPLSFPD
jgi:hypothetical protein